jgi:hypothetical protein
MSIRKCLMLARAWLQQQNTDDSRDHFIGKQKQIILVPHIAACNSIFSAFWVFVHFLGRLPSEGRYCVERNLKIQRCGAASAQSYLYSAAGGRPEAP